MNTKSEKTKTLETEDISLTVYHKPHCIVEYEVKASKNLCVEARNKAAKSVGKDVVAPGFRKGKAPVEIVSKRYPQELDKRWQEQIANRCYQESAKLAAIPVVNKEATVGFNMRSHSLEGAHLILSFETVPSIPVVDPAKCILKAIKRPEVSKEKVDETIRQTQMFFAEWKTVEARPLKEGDFVILDLEITDEEPHQKVFSDTRFEITDRSMAKWMKTLLLGKTPGEVLEGVSEPDEHLSEEEKKQYPPRKVKVTVKQIDEVNLPELDEVFAKKLGIDDPKTLEKRIENLLNKKADEHVRQSQRELVTEFLLSYHFELPKSVVEKEVKFRLEQLTKDPNTKTQWESGDNQKKEEIFNQTRLEAEKAIRMFYLCSKIASEQNIDISPKSSSYPEIDPIESLLYPNSNPHSPLQPDIKQAETFSKILLEKTEDWIIAHSRSEPSPKSSEKKETPKKDSPAPKQKPKKEDTPTSRSKTASKNTEAKTKPKTKKEDTPTSKSKTASKNTKAKTKPKTKKEDTPNPNGKTSPKPKKGK